MKNPENKIIVLISAGTEWLETKKHFLGITIKQSPFGEYFETKLSNNTPVTFFHSGWGKIPAAASTQFVINKWNPELIINLGTCGGFEGCIEPGTIILANKTIVYDIIEQMGDQDEAIDFFATDIDLSWYTNKNLNDVKCSLLLSADRDIIPSEIKHLKEKYNAVAADWESGAIAYIANKNKTKCLIFRGVSDIVNEVTGEAYNKESLFKERTKHIMNKLIISLPNWINDVIIQTALNDH